MSHETNQFNSEQNGIALNNQEGKSLDELAGEGQIATPETDEERGMVEIDKNGNVVKSPKTPDEIIKRYDELQSAEEVDDYEEIEQELLSEAINALREITKTEKEEALPTEEEIMKPADFKTGIFGMRGDIELVKSKVKNWQGHPALEPIDPNPNFLQQQEMKANLELAYRHLEDARMRLGKAIQAFDGGKSCYPR